MKNYDEMARYVLACRDEQLKIKKQKRVTMIKYMSVTASFAFIIVFGYQIQSNYTSSQKIPTETSHSTYYSETTLTSADIIAENTNIQTSTDIQKIISESQTEKEIINSDVISTKEEKFTEKIISNETTITQSETKEIISQTEKPKDTTALINSETTTEKIYGYTSDFIDETTETPDGNIPSEETGNIPLKWEEMNNTEKYFSFDLNNQYYEALKTEVSSDNIEIYLYNVTMNGYDFYTDTYYQCIAKAYKLINQSENDYIAIQFDNEDTFYLYKKY